MLSEIASNIVGAEPVWPAPSKIISVNTDETLVIHYTKVINWQQIHILRGMCILLFLYNKYDCFIYKLWVMRITCNLQRENIVKGDIYHIIFKICILHSIDDYVLQLIYVILHSIERYVLYLKTIKIVH
jgi:hypothetical protein